MSAIFDTAQSVYAKNNKKNKQELRKATINFTK
jgi:hypothetical protein